MSYKRAWLLLDSLNAAFEPVVVTTTLGSSGGGGARLTDFGHELVKRYRRAGRLQQERQTLIVADRLNIVASALG